MTTKTILESKVPGHEGPCRQIDFRYSRTLEMHVGVFRNVRKFLFLWWRAYGDEFDGLRRPADATVTEPRPIERRPPVERLDKYGRITSVTRNRHSGLARTYSDVQKPAPTPAPSPGSSITEESDPFPSRYGTRADWDEPAPFRSGRGGDFAGAGATGSWDFTEPARDHAPTEFAALSESIERSNTGSFMVPEPMPPAPAPEPESCRASDYAASSPPPSDPPSDPPASDSSSSSGGSSGSGD
jgi:hypothetical protein